MKKKYPFSNKAVKAMLVAALAFSPVAGVVTVSAEATEFSIAALPDSVVNLINKFDEFYDQQTDVEKKAIKDTQEKISNISDAQWRQIAAKVSIYPNKITEKADLLKDLTVLTSSATKAQLEINAGNFISKNAQNVDALFGTNITVEALISFIADVQVKYFELSGDLNEVENPSLAMTKLKNALKTVGLLDEHQPMSIALLRVLDLDETVNALNAINNGTLSVYLSDNSGGTGGGGGGGGPVTPPVEEPGETPETPPTKPGQVTLPEGSTEVVKETNAAGKVEVVTKVDSGKVTEIVNAITAEKKVVPVTLEKPAAGEAAKAELPASLFTEAKGKNEGAVVEIQTEEASYQLPAKEINVADLAGKLGVNASDVKITVSVNVVNPADVQNEIDNHNLDVVGPIIEFTVKAVSGNKEHSVKTFSTYVKREIKLGQKVNSNRATAIRFEADGSFSSVPTLFGNNAATINSTSNSKYTIVENDKTFPDIDNGLSWAEAHIEKLASKYIIQGRSNTEYDPRGEITRAEFATLIARGLGLVAQDATKSYFSDIPTDHWVNKDGAISAAYEAGLIQGLPGGTFAPDASIKRGDAALIVARALEYTKAADSKFDTSKKATYFADNENFGYMTSGIEKAFQAEIMTGHDTGLFGANEFTTREQMAKVIDKVLQTSELIN